MTSESPGVLYVGRDKYDSSIFCPGSTVCISIAEKLQPHVTIQDCSVLRENQQLPSWLNGTPIYVSENEGVPYRGRDAIHHMHILVRQTKKSSPSRSANNAQNTPRPDIQIAARRSNIQMEQDTIESAKSKGCDEEGISDPFEDISGSGVKITENGKITNQDLEKFMQSREATQPNDERQV